MAIQLADVTPSIALFNAQVARGDSERRQEQADFRQRFGFEQEQVADKARREAVMAAVGERRTGATPAAAPAGAPAIAGVTATQPAPAMPAHDQGAILPAGPQAGGAQTFPVAPQQQPAISSFSAQPARQETVYSRGGVPVSAPQDFGNAAPLPATQAGPPPAPAISAFSAQPATGAPAQPSPTAPATASAPRVPASGATQGARPPAARAGTDDILTRLTATPGTGKEALSLYAADEQSRRQVTTAEHQRKLEGIRLFSEARKDHDYDTMKVISLEYRLGIPDAALNNRQVMAALDVGIGLAKSIGINDDMRAIAYAKGYLHAKAGGAEENAARQAGLGEAQKAEKPDEAAHWFTTPENEVRGVSKTGKVIKTGEKAHPPKMDVAGGSGGREQSSAKERIARELFDEAAASGKPITKAEAYDRASRADPKGKDDVAKERLALTAARADRGWRRDPTATLNRARRMYGLSPVESAPADAAPAQSPAAGTKRLRFDAQGNPAQ